MSGQTAPRTDAERRAQELFQGGRNCAQSVLLALLPPGAGLTPEAAAALAQPLGGGVGGLGEVCGALSGALLAVGLRMPDEDKEAVYAAVQHLADGFRQEQGSLYCRDLKPEDPAFRREACGGCVACAVRQYQRRWQPDDS